jgi:hypothetical protein
MGLAEFDLSHFTSLGGEYGARDLQLIGRRMHVLDGIVRGLVLPDLYFKVQRYVPTGNQVVGRDILRYLVTPPSILPLLKTCTDLPNFADCTAAHRPDGLLLITSTS